MKECRIHNAKTIDTPLWAKEYNICEDLCPICWNELSYILPTKIPDYFKEYINIISLKEISIKGKGRKVIQQYLNRCYEIKTKKIKDEIKDLEGSALVEFILNEGKKNTWGNHYHCTLQSLTTYKKKSHNRYINPKDFACIVGEIYCFEEKYNIKIWNEADFM